MVSVDKCIQKNDVMSEYEALFSVIYPILEGLALSLPKESVKHVGGYENITLSLFTDLYRPGDGDCGICFEYAVHNAILDKNPEILNRIDSVLTKFCKIKNGDPTSILFGAEKNGTLQLIDSVASHLTNESQLLPGTKGQPVKLKRHIQGVVNAFRKEDARQKLPSSINGLWKADLFIGKTEPDKWIGTTVKINPAQLEAARGLRLAIVPAKFNQNKSDKIYKHETKNLIVCPVPYDKSFMEIFYEGFGIVREFIKAHGKMPKEINLPSSLDRLVCKELVNRANFPILDVVEVLKGMGQPYLMEIENKSANLDITTVISQTKLNKIIAPISTKQGGN